MRRFAYIPIVAAGLALAPVGTPAQDAQTDDSSGGMLVSLLENLLSNENQSIRVIGLEGALTARARLKELQVLDKNGPWLTVRGAVLDWNRLALVRGRFSVNELSADEVIVTRAPEPADTVDLPAPEAASEPFSIPELPVAVMISKLAVQRIELGEALTGQAADLDLNGALNLADGALMAQLSSTRLDRPGDAVRLDLNAVNATREISIDLDFNEAPGGLVGTVLNLPGTPELELTVAGSGLYNDLITDIALQTDGEPRLTGTVTLAARGAETPGTIFTADVGGDLRPLMDQTFAPFFGADTRLTLAGHVAPEGEVEIEEFKLDAQALGLDGAISLSGGQLTAASLDGRVGNGTDQVVLPVAGGQHSLQNATLTLRADRSDESWSLGAVTQGLALPELDIETARIVSGGSFVQGDAIELSGDIQVAADGLTFADSALAQAVGAVLRLNGRLDWDSRENLQLQNVALEGAGYLANLDAKLTGLGGNGQLDATAKIDAGNLAQFAGLAGIDLSGSAKANATLSAELLTGKFDVQADTTAQDLGTGIAELDPLLIGETALSLDAARGTEGLTLRGLTLNGTALSADASGLLQSRAAKLDLTAKLDDLARIEPALPGPVTLSADVTRDDDGPWSMVAKLDAPKGAGGEITAQYDGENATAEVDLGAVDLGDLVPPDFLPLSVTGDAQMTGGDLTAQLDLTSGSSITASVDGKLVDGNGTSKITGTVNALPDLPEALFPITLSGTGQMQDGTASAKVDVAAADAGDLAVTATMSPDGVLDLDLTGDVQALDGLVPPEIAPVTLTATADRGIDGLWGVVADLRAADVGTLDLAATYHEGGEGQADLAVRVAPIEGLIPPGVAPITLGGRATLAADQSAMANLALMAADDGLSLTIAAQYDGTETAAVQIDGDITSLGDLLPREFLPVALTAQGDLKGTDATAKADITAGAFGELNVTGSGDLQGQAHADLTGQFRRTGVAEIDRLLPLDLTGTATQAADGTLASELRLSGQNASYLQAKASRAPDSGQITASFDALLDELQRLLPQIPGQLSAQGEASSNGPVWTIGLDVTGPADIKATANGTYDIDAQNAAIKTQGNLQLSGLNPILSPNQIAGTLGFDLALNGAPALNNISGTIRTQGSSFDLPGMGQQITPINVAVSMDSGQATLNALAGLEAGGSATVTGPIGLVAPYPANLNIALQQLVLTDNLSVRSGASGTLSFNGNLLGSSQLAGTIRIAPTRVNVANLGGAVSAAPIPEITHVGESSASYLTREHAGLIASEGGGTLPDIGLDLVIQAVDGVTVNGMGLDARLGGTINVNGALDDIRPNGAIELETGTILVLGRPLRLTDGRVSLQDTLTPYIRFAASNVNSEGTATIVIEGPLDQPDVTVSSIPERPPEEALALLLFGNRQSRISPIRLAQIAAQFATSGGSLFGGDISEEETARGRILNPTEHLYTDFAVNSDGQNEVIVNLDVTENITLRGTVDNAGDTSLGMFFQRDY